MLEVADDLSVDFPCMWSYLAEILVEMCAKQVITFKDIVLTMIPLRGWHGSTKFLAELIKFLIEMKDVTWVKEWWIDSQVSLADVINKEDVNNFVKENASLNYFLN